MLDLGNTEAFATSYNEIDEMTYRFREDMEEISNFAYAVFNSLKLDEYLSSKNHNVTYWKMEKEAFDRLNNGSIKGDWKNPARSIGTALMTVIAEKVNEVYPQLNCKFEIVPNPKEKYRDMPMFTMNGVDIEIEYNIKEQALSGYKGIIKTARGELELSIEDYINIAESIDTVCSELCSRREDINIPEDYFFTRDFDLEYAITPDFTQKDWQELLDNANQVLLVDKNNNPVLTLDEFLEFTNEKSYRFYTYDERIEQLADKVAERKEEIDAQEKPYKVEVTLVSGRTVRLGVEETPERALSHIRYVNHLKEKDCTNNLSAELCEDKKNIRLCYKAHIDITLKDREFIELYLSDKETETVLLEMIKKQYDNRNYEEFLNFYKMELKTYDIYERVPQKGEQEKPVKKSLEDAER